jgi:hypothetical protein
MNISFSVIYWFIVYLLLRDNSIKWRNSNWYTFLIWWVMFVIIGSFYTPYHDLLDHGYLILTLTIGILIGRHSKGIWTRKPRNSLLSDSIQRKS